MLKRPTRMQGAIDRQTLEDRKDGLKNLAIMLLALLVILLLALYAWSFFKPAEKRVLEPESAAQPAVKVETHEVSDATEKPSYEFYEILPKQELRVIPEGMSAAPSPKDNQALPVDKVVHKDGAKMKVLDEAPPPMPEPPTKPAPKDSEIATTQTTAMTLSIEKANPHVSYILQVRSYDDSDMAEMKRAEVMMAGVDAKVVKRDGAGAPIYTVVSLAMNSRDEAMIAYQRLLDSGIDSVVIEQR